MTHLLGLPLEAVLERLRANGIEPDVRRTRSPRGETGGTERVVRVSEDGRTVTVACFPDQVKTEDTP